VQKCVQKMLTLRMHAFTSGRIESERVGVKGRVRFPKRTRRRSCRDSGRPESAEFFFCFFGKVVLCNETPRSRVFRVFEFFEFFRVFSMGVGFGQGSAPLIPSRRCLNERSYSEANFMKLARASVAENL
jgi:hypothetical protein